MLDLAYIIVGIGILVWSADRFTDGAAAIARNFGLSPIVVGLTIVAIGSSAPEIAISIMASINGNAAIAIGNAIGSNITNIALVLGVSAIVVTMHVESKIISREFPLLFVYTALAGLLIFDGDVSLLDGIILLSSLLVYIAWLTHIAISTRESKEDKMLRELTEELPDMMSNQAAIIWTIVGLILLPISSKILVMGASGVATYFGISELVIGLSIVAIGTSLPELAATIASAIKGEHELAIGNIIGSNIFNIAAVLGIPGLVGISFGPEVFWRDYLIMAGLTIAFFAVAYSRKGGRTIKRWEGMGLLLAFIGYQIYLYFSLSTAA